MDIKNAATEIADTLVSLSGGPLLDRNDGIKFVETYIRELVCSEREACAKLAESGADYALPQMAEFQRSIARVIRSRP